MAFDRSCCDGKKYCTGCWERKPLDEFSPHPTGFLRSSSSCVLCRTAGVRRWRSNNPDKARAVYRNSYHVNLDRRRAYHKKWTQENPEKSRTRCIRRRGLIESQAGDVTKEEWLRIKADYGNACAYCNQARPLTMDHVTPLSRGGEHSAENVVPACRECNSAKRVRPLVVFLASRASHQ